MPRDPLLGVTARCFICQATENLRLIEPPTYVCDDHPRDPYMTQGDE